MIGNRLMPAALTAKKSGIGEVDMLGMILHLGTSEHRYDTDFF